MAECTFHPGRETLLSCSRCGRPACTECLTPAAVGQHCVGCAKGQPEPGAPGAARYKLRRLLLGDSEDARLLRPGGFFYALLALFAALCAGAVLLDSRVDAELLIGGERDAVVSVISVAIILVGAVLGLTFHEWAHAFVAYRGGDWSVREQGYLTLDVRRYGHPMLSVGLPLFFLLIGALPIPGGAVWINHSLLRSRLWETAVSLAGPAASAAWGLLLVAIHATGVLGGALLLDVVLMYLANIQLALTVLNLVPIPGLDGYGAIEPLLPSGIAELLAPLRQWGIFIVLILLVNGQLDFVWTWSTDVLGPLGVEQWELALGQFFADPGLR